MAGKLALKLGTQFVRQIFFTYKPDREAYLGAIELLETKPANVLPASSHNYDLAAAGQHGMKTAFVARPKEYGDLQARDFKAESDWDFIARDFVELAARMGV